MSKVLDLRGQRFGKLTVVRPKVEFGYSPDWICKCDCGNTTVVRGASLRSGNTKSCGCMRRENPGRPKSPDRGFIDPVPLGIDGSATMDAFEILALWLRNADVPVSKSSCTYIAKGVTHGPFHSFPEAVVNALQDCVDWELRNTQTNSVE